MIVDRWEYFIGSFDADTMEIEISQLAAEAIGLNSSIIAKLKTDSKHKGWINLNKFGEARWELTQVIEAPSAKEYRKAILKRPVYFRETITE